MPDMSQSQPSIRVAVVEDRAEDLDKTRKLLETSPGFECVAACRSGKDALRILPGCRPDIVLMDIVMPELSGIDCVRQLQPLLPEAQFMMLTVVEDHERIYDALAAGATGYLLKQTPLPKLLEAIRELHGGGAPMSGQIARQVVAVFRQPPASRAAVAKLFPVEQRVLDLLARGLLYKEVADELSISLNTVRTHVWHIYGKLHVHNRTEALLKVQGPGLKVHRSLFSVIH